MENAAVTIAALSVSPFIGSFIATSAIRLPAGEPIVVARSACRSCGVTLGAASLVPILSWALLRGRCGTCGARIGAYYPLIETATLFLALWAATVVSDWLLLTSCILGWTLLALSIIDWRTYTLPDPLTLPLIPAGLAVIAVIDQDRLGGHALAALIGFSVFAGLAYAYHALRGRDGLGLGDAKLFAAAGAWVGWEVLPSVLLIGTVACLASAFIGRAFGGTLSWSQRLAFGPYLALGFWIVWLHGPLVLRG